MYRPVRTGNESGEARARILEVAEKYFRTAPATRFQLPLI